EGITQRVQVNVMMLYVARAPRDHSSSFSRYAYTVAARACWRAGWAARRSSPISARTGSSAADNTRSLSSYPVARTCLTGGSPGSLIPLSIASQLAESPRYSLLFLKPLLLQQQRIGKCLIVVRIAKHQLLQFFRRSCQQQRIIRLYVRNIDAILRNLRLQPACAQKCHLDRILFDLHARDCMSADEMHAIKLAYPFAALGINVQKPERSQLDETHVELLRHLLFSVFFLYNQLVLFLFPLRPSLFECKRHVPFFVGPRLVQSGISFQIYLCVKRLK